MLRSKKSQGLHDMPMSRAAELALALAFEGNWGSTAAPSWASGPLGKLSNSVCPGCPLEI